MTLLRAVRLHRRPAKLDDLQFLMELRRNTMGPHRAAAGIPESTEQIQAKVLADLEGAWMVLNQDELIGLLKATTGTSPWSLSQVQLLPAWQRRGIGTELISSFLAEASAAAAVVEIKVLKVNPALRLYKRLGFKIVSESVRGYTLRTEA